MLVCDTCPRVRKGMSVPISDDLVAALRAQLAGDAEEHERLWSHVDQAEVQATYAALVEGAFFAAVDRRFGKSSTASDVVEFVGDLRSRSEHIEDSLDPAVAERLIMAVMGEGSLDNIDNTTRFRTEGVLLAALVHDEHLDDSELDAFMAKARKFGDYLLS